MACWRSRRARIVYLLASTVAAVGLCHALYWLAVERRELADYLAKVPGLDTLPPYQQARTLQAAVAADIRTQPPFRYWGSRWRVSGMLTVHEILRYREGHCGEGAKLLHRLLRVIGVDSRLVLLQFPRGHHAMLEILVDGDWVLLDTIRSPLGPFPEGLRLGDVFVPPQNRYASVSNRREFFSCNNYSYLVVTRGLRNLGVRVYFLEPFPRWVNTLLLTDHLASACAWGALLLLLVGLQLALLRNKPPPPQR